MRFLNETIGKVFPASMRLYGSETDCNDIICQALGIIQFLLIHRRWDNNRIPEFYLVKLQNMGKWHEYTKMSHLSEREQTWAKPCAELTGYVVSFSTAQLKYNHYTDVMMTTMASQITSLTVVYSTVYSDADQRKHQSSASLAFVRGIHRDRWIPRTKGQLRGKCFHLMTSSCSV